MDKMSFDSQRIAEGYLKRPWLHKKVIEQIKADYHITEKFKNGLDVGCGAGLSTKGLNLICDKVTGTDISAEMINVCNRIYKDKSYFFYVAKAEETRIPEEKYDILTAAGVINWVDKDKFLANASQIMRSNGLIVIYDFGITDQMKEETEYTDWYQNRYLPKFLKPSRNENVWGQNDLTQDFLMEKQTVYTMEYAFNMEEFIDFMMIQSNINVKIENGEISEKETKEWMQDTLKSIFRGKAKTLIFSGYNWYIRKK